MFMFHGNSWKPVPHIPSCLHSIGMFLFFAGHHSLSVKYVPLAAKRYINQECLLC